VLRAWTERPLTDLLESHGLGGVPEAAFPNDGWSGASLTRLERPIDGHAFILKRTSWAADWIARSTRDHALREGFVASIPMPLPFPLVAPYHGVAADGTAVAILMPDLSAQLLDWERPAGEPPTSPATIDRVLEALARLHAMPWPIAAEPDARIVWPSAPLRERLLLLGPRSSELLAADGSPPGAASRRLGRVRATGAGRAGEPSRRSITIPHRCWALSMLPRTGVHGDMKLANVGSRRRPGGTHRLAADGARAGRGRARLAAGVQQRRAAERPDAVLERYRHALERIAGSPVGAITPFDPAASIPDLALRAVVGAELEPRFRTVDEIVGDWDAQRDCAWIVGLLLRGWRKGLDTEAGARLASGVAADEDLAFWCERAVEAAGRRL
jgi:hypothetical protein